MSCPATTNGSPSCRLVQKHAGYTCHDVKAVQRPSRALCIRMTQIRQSCVTSLPLTMPDGGAAHAGKMASLRSLHASAPIPQRVGPLLDQ